jgi:uncharacterized protein
MDNTCILFIHGGGDDGYGSDSHLSHSLEKLLGKTYRVKFPRMPTPDFDSTESWPKKIHDTIAACQPTFLVGHSFGGSNLLQYLVRYGTPKGIRGIFLLAPPFWGSDSDWDYKEYVLPPKFAEKLSREIPLFLYQCRDDEVVDILHLDRYAKAIPWANVRKLSEGGHQFGNDLSDVAREITAINQQANVPQRLRASAKSKS